MTDTESEWESLVSAGQDTLSGFLLLRGEGLLGRVAWNKTWAVVDSSSGVRTLMLSKNPSAAQDNVLELDSITKVALCKSADIAKSRACVFAVYAAATSSFEDGPLYFDARDDETLLAWMDFLASVLDPGVVLKYRGPERADGSDDEAGAESSGSASMMSSSAASLSMSGSASAIIGGAYKEEPSGAVSGVLDKKGEGFLVPQLALWKTRFFRLDKGVLTWSKSDIAPPRGSLTFTGPDAIVGVYAAVADEAAGLFAIHTPGRRYDIRAKSDPAAAAAWVDAINAVIASDGSPGQAAASPEAASTDATSPEAAS